MKTALALLAFAFVPVAAVASNPYGSASMEQQPSDMERFCLAVRRLAVGMTENEVVRVLNQFAPPGYRGTRRACRGSHLTPGSAWLLRLDVRARSGLQVQNRFQVGCDRNRLECAEVFRGETITVKAREKP